MDPEKAGDFVEDLNPDSLEVRPRCFIEPSLVDAEPGTRLQFERLGYFCVDTADSGPGRPVFNRIVTLRDAWARQQKQQPKQQQKKKQRKKK